MGRRNFPVSSISTTGAPVGQSLGELFQTLRRRLGKTQDQIAGAAGITRNYLSMLEHDQANPTFEVVARVFGALGYQAQFQIAEMDAPQPEATAHGVDIVQ